MLSSGAALLPLHLPSALHVVEHVQYRWEDGRVVFET
jgi:hypothetical protein